MSTFVRLKEEDREKLFSNFKSNKDCSWEDIYPELGVSRSMFFNYLSGKYDIPLQIFRQIEKVTDVNISDYKELEKDKFSKKEVEEFSLNQDLSEILGILGGDGYLSPDNYEISVTLNSQEKNYALYVKDLFEEIFEIDFNLRKQENTLRIKTYSKEIVNQLNKNYNTPLGRKKGQLTIPKNIKNSQHLSKFYIRGLFDTDGSIYLRREIEPVLEIISRDKDFLEEVKRTLEFLGFNPGISGKNLYIYKIGSINKFFKDIKPANEKHLEKFRQYPGTNAPIV